MPDLLSIEFISGCIAPFIAFCIGLLAFQRLNAFYRIIFVQVAFYIFTIFGAYAVTAYQDAHGLPKNNHWFYNLCFPVECAILAGAASVYFARRKFTVGILGGYVLFFIVYVFQVIDKGINGLANFAIVTEALLMVILYLLILYHRVKDVSAVWIALPEFWLCIGIAVYFGCIVPFFSMINYLWTYHAELSEILFNVINLFFGNVRYLLIGVSFWLIFRQHPSVYGKAV